MAESCGLHAIQYNGMRNGKQMVCDPTWVAASKMDVQVQATPRQLEQCGKTILLQVVYARWRVTSSDLLVCLCCGVHCAEFITITNTALP